MGNHTRWEAAAHLVDFLARVSHDPAHLVGDPAGAVDDHASTLAGDACTDASCWCCPPLPRFMLSTMFALNPIVLD